MEDRWSHSRHSRYPSDLEQSSWHAPPRSQPPPSSQYDARTSSDRRSGAFQEERHPQRVAKSTRGSVPEAATTQQYNSNGATSGVGSGVMGDCRHEWQSDLSAFKETHTQEMAPSSSARGASAAKSASPLTRAPADVTIKRKGAPTHRPAHETFKGAGKQSRRHNTAGPNQLTNRHPQQTRSKLGSQQGSTLGQVAPVKAEDHQPNEQKEMYGFGRRQTKALAAPPMLLPSARPPQTLSRRPLSPRPRPSRPPRPQAQSKPAHATVRPPPPPFSSYWQRPFVQQPRPRRQVSNPYLDGMDRPSAATNPYLQHTPGDPHVPAANPYLAGAPGWARRDVPSWIDEAPPAPRRAVNPYVNEPPSEETSLKERQMPTEPEPDARHAKKPRLCQGPAGESDLQNVETLPTHSSDPNFLSLPRSARKKIRKRERAEAQAEEKRLRKERKKAKEAAEAAAQSLAAAESQGISSSGAIAGATVSMAAAVEQHTASTQEESAARSSSPATPPLPHASLLQSKLTLPAATQLSTCVIVPEPHEFMKHDSTDDSQNGGGQHQDAAATDRDQGQSTLPPDRAESHIGTCMDRETVGQRDENPLSGPSPIAEPPREYPDHGALMTSVESKRIRASDSPTRPEGDDAQTADTGDELCRKRLGSEYQSRGSSDPNVDGATLAARTVALCEDKICQLPLSEPRYAHRWMSTMRCQDQDKDTVLSVAAKGRVFLRSLDDSAPVSTSQLHPLAVPEDVRRVSTRSIAVASTTRETLGDGGPQITLVFSHPESRTDDDGDAEQHHNEAVQRMGLSLVELDAKPHLAGATAVAPFLATDDAALSLATGGVDGAVYAWSYFGKAHARTTRLHAMLHRTPVVAIETLMKTDLVVSGSKAKGGGTDLVAFDGRETRLVQSWKSSDIIAHLSRTTHPRVLDASMFRADYDQHKLYDLRASVKPIVSFGWASAYDLPHLGRPVFHRNFCIQGCPDGRIRTWDLRNASEVCQELRVCDSPLGDSVLCMPSSDVSKIREGQQQQQQQRPPASLITLGGSSAWRTPML